jgi:hypothetical protein
MSTFEWKTFLDNHNIEYIERGHNIGRDWLGLSCPYCNDDPSHHLGVSLKTGHWHCWRRHHDGGSRPHNLIMKLIGCTYQQAEEIVGSTLPEYGYADLSGLINLDFLFPKIQKIKMNENKTLEFPDEITPIQIHSFAFSIVSSYLESRGYNKQETVSLIRMYDLHFAFNGPFSYRIVFPIRYNNKLVTWTGRSIAQSERLRYKSLSLDEEKARMQGLPQALKNIKHCLFDYDDISGGGSCLVITEGPFDACRISHFGDKLGIYGTCLFGLQASQEQLSLIAEIRHKFKDLVVIGDSFDALREMTRTVPEWLSYKAIILPEKYGDPAELDEFGFNELIQNIEKWASDTAT